MKLHTNRPLDTDVIIAGAGPTGLLLAGDLAAAGIRVRVIEKRRDESNLSRAFAVHSRTLEALDARGLADELIADGEVLSGIRLLGSHQVRMAALDTRFPFVVATPQYRTERVLRHRAEANGVDFAYGYRVTGLRQDDGGVDVDIADADGEEHAIRASYVVGTDGLHSAVRHALGLSFDGFRVISSMMLADVKLTSVPDGPLTMHSNRHGMALVGSLGRIDDDDPDEYYRVIARAHGDTSDPKAPVELQEIRETFLRVYGDDFGMHSPRWISRFHSDERQAPHYRVGRVFLAGDAAHVHSPAGGQGMNTGLQDAANLSWKLAAAVKGTAPEDLLDTYEAERHPVGAMVLRSSHRLLKIILLRNPLALALRPLILGTVLRIPKINRKIAGQLSGIAIRYGDKGRVGQRAADIPLRATTDGPSRLYEALRSGHFVLVTGPRDPKPPADLAPHVDVVFAAEPTTPTLVRPDGYIAWTADQGRTPNWPTWITPAHQLTTT
ncbi:MAG TPA: FAD-dependent monooxygenase [Stackebrandtia sp.]|uniref:FAD-dependent monooxygenase n=1 Tax=Stackebrandtia sp. TaxID=2023065 RepID=UPI002D4456A6|nr:FAD-dependent monooxygenase [Stackebrandtia sp.]HZE41113.1 FAD-dependent monooxygenase [Stackebrandtia sp.]